MTPEELGKCAACGKAPFKTAAVSYRITVETVGLDMGRLRQQAGLEMMIGNAAVAAALGSRDVIREIDSGSFALCLDCLMQAPALVQWLEVRSRDE